MSPRAGCPGCRSKAISKISQQWLNNFKNIKKEKCIIINNKRFRVDGYNFADKIIYEFYGDFWHGNPNKFNLNDINPIIGRTYKELYNNTINRENIFKKAGYKVISIWESDYKNLINK